MEVALDVLEPFGGVARRALQLEHLDPAFILVSLEGRCRVGSQCR